MTFSKIFIVVAVLLFGVIGVTAWVKKQNKSAKTEVVVAKNKPLDTQKKVDPDLNLKKSKELVTLTPTKSVIPDVDRVQELFEVGNSKLDFLVETVTYKSRVPWMQGRSAWLADYASHYATSRHFIARSLNRKPDYLTQKVAEGDKFNVLRNDREINFYLVIDLSACKMLFYALDLQKNQHTLLKSYNVGLGRLDPSKPSGSLTPLGKYSLGSKVATYKPGSMGIFHHETTEMIRVFGTRWIPFEKEIEKTSAPAKGYGIHGAPFVEGKDLELHENLECISKYESDGCIRLATKDMEELFAIVITRPTTVEIVGNFSEAKVPGKAYFPEKNELVTK